jgi:hypothetical protein
MSWEWWNNPEKRAATPPPPKHKPEGSGWISVHDALPEPGETPLEWLLGGGADGLLAPGETMLIECIEGIGVGYNLVRYSYRGQYEQEHVWFGLSFIVDSNGYAMSDIPVSHWRRLPEPPGREGT